MGVVVQQAGTQQGQELLELRQAVREEGEQ